MIIAPQYLNINTAYKVVRDILSQLENSDSIPDDKTKFLARLETAEANIKDEKRKLLEPVMLTAKQLESYCKNFLPDVQRAKDLLNGKVKSRLTTETYKGKGKDKSRPTAPRPASSGGGSASGSASSGGGSASGSASGK